MMRKASLEIRRQPQHSPSERPFSQPQRIEVQNALSWGRPSSQGTHEKWIARFDTAYTLHSLATHASDKVVRTVAYRNPR